MSDQLPTKQLGDFVATTGQKPWPPVGTFVAAHGQFFMAVVTEGGDRGRAVGQELESTVAGSAAAPGDRSRRSSRRTRPSLRRRWRGSVAPTNLYRCRRWWSCLYSVNVRIIWVLAHISVMLAEVMPVGWAWCSRGCGW